ncbi:hypothetical protein GC177_02965 [bacterium]|nr:hypothetical protein [bacterium]
MAAKLRKKRQFILSAGDDGCILVYMEGKTVLRRLYAPSPSPDDVKHFDSLFQTDNRATILLMFDNMDQSYVQHTLPPVSSLSINKIIKRRLDRDFLPQDIKGALSQGRNKTGRKEWYYMFASLANNPPISTWVDYCLDKPNILEGIYLLPVEAETLGKSLDKLFPEEGAKPERKKTKKKKGEEEEAPVVRWHLIVSHQKVGGFRQVVLKNGRLAFTRMATPVGEPTPEVIAGNIEQEMTSTLEYLKRLGFNSSDWVDLTVIVAADIRSHLSLEKRNAKRILVKTPHEIATAMQVSNATEPSDHFGDIVFAISLAINRKKVLRLFTPELKKIFDLFQFEQFAKVVSVVSIPLAVVATIWLIVSGVLMVSDISDAEKKDKQGKARKDEIQAEVNKLPASIDEIAEVTKISDFLEKNSYNPLKFLATFAQALDETTVIHSIKWASSNEAYPNSGASMGQSTTPVKAEIKVEYAPSGDGQIDELLQRTEVFYRKLSGIFPDYKINFSNLPGVVSRTEDFRVDLNKEKEASPAAQDTSITYTMEGPIKDPNAPATGAPAP